MQLKCWNCGQPRTNDDLGVCNDEICVKAAINGRARVKENIEAKKKASRKYYQHPEAKERIREYQRKYYQRPEVKAKRRKYRQRPEVKTKAREYYHRPEVKERVREYRQRLEVKAKKRENYQRKKQLREEE